MINSKQPRKQRKFRYNAPMHARHRMVAAHISKELRAKLATKRRSAPLHRGDKIKVMRGEYKGKIGKVLEVDLNDLKVLVESVTRQNSKGKEKLLPLDPSNLLILDGEFTRDRLAMIQRSGKSAKKQ